jgi:hypothetical protein
MTGCPVCIACCSSWRIANAWPGVHSSGTAISIFMVACSKRVLGGGHLLQGPPNKRKDLARQDHSQEICACEALPNGLAARASGLASGVAFAVRPCQLRPASQELPPAGRLHRPVRGGVPAQHHPHRPHARHHRPVLGSAMLARQLETVTFALAWSQSVTRPGGYPILNCGSYGGCGVESCSQPDNGRFGNSHRLRQRASFASTRLNAHLNYTGRSRLSSCVISVAYHSRNPGIGVNW